MLRSRWNLKSRSAGMALVLAGSALTGVLVGGLGEAQGQQGASVPVFAGQPSFANVFEQVNPAVVTVAVTMQSVGWQTSGRLPFTGTPFEEFFQEFGNSGQGKGFPQPAPRNGVGSGFIIDRDGHIATNFHVVDGASTVTVTLQSGEEREARVVGTDPRTDLALIKIDDAGDLPALRFGDSDSARVGEWVLAIGNPFGLGGTATAGIISARGRDIQAGAYDEFLQIDAAINSGNSGGPVFNAAGEVIGINTAIYSPTGGSVGIGFAIPSNQARAVLEDLRADGVVSRGWLGIAMAPDAPAAAREGVTVEAVDANGPAAAAGLLKGDIVTGFAGERVDSTRTLARLVGSRNAGEEVELEVLRAGEQVELTVELGELDEARLQAAATPQQPAQPNGLAQPYGPAQPYGRKPRTEPDFRR